MKKFIIASLSILIISCSEKKTETVTENNSSEVIDDQNREIDSLKGIISENENGSENENPTPNETPNEAPGETVDESELPDLSGKHNLTLQWISWDNPGTITFTKIGVFKYRVSGGQKKGNDYLKIEGEIEHATNDQLLFEGTIETNIDANGGKCLRTGRQIFLATKNRKYWRMQNMVECFGLTDYVDIYF